MNVCSAEDHLSGCSWSLFSLSYFGGIWGFPHRLHFTKVFMFLPECFVVGGVAQGISFPPPSCPVSSFSLLVPNSLLILLLLLHLLLLHISSSLLRPLRLRLSQTAQLCLEIKRDEATGKLSSLCPQTPFKFSNIQTVSITQTHIFVLLTV